MRCTNVQAATGAKITEDKNTVNHASAPNAVCSRSVRGCALTFSGFRMSPLLSVYGKLSAAITPTIARSQMAEPIADSPSGPQQARPCARPWGAGRRIR